MISTIYRYMMTGMIALVLLITAMLAQPLQAQITTVDSNYYVPIREYVNYSISNGEESHIYDQVYNQIISISFNKTPLEEALSEIASKADIRLAYDKHDLSNQVVTLSSPKVTVSAALLKTLEDTGLEALASTNGQVLIRKKLQRSKAKKQEITVSGKVTDAKSGKALPGANVIVKGTTRGTSTDKKGHYDLVVGSSRDTLVFTFIGYKKKQVPIHGRSTINISLQSSTLQGEGITKVGYGEQSTDLVTGSISSVTSDQIEKVPINNVGNALFGKVPGVQLVQTTSLPGESGPSIYIRGVSTLSSGNSHPIYVIDGDVVRGGRQFGQLDPNNIKSISVLKDAAATAVYGIEGANGVIVVETKRGHQSETPKITINSTFGFQSPTKVQEYEGSYHWARGYSIAQRTDGVDSSNFRFSPETIRNFRTGAHPIVYPNTNWEEYLFKDRAARTKTNINVSGGTEDVQYYVAGGFLRQDGFLKDFPSSPAVHNFNPSFDRFNIRTNLDFDVTPATKLSVTASGRFSDRIRGNAGNFEGIYSSAPFSGAGVHDGRIVTRSTDYVPGRAANVTPRLFGSGFTKNTNNTANIHLKGNQQLGFITKGLELQLKASYRFYYRLNKHRNSSYAFYNAHFKTDRDPNVDPGDPGDSTVVYTKNGSNGILNYSQNTDRDRDWKLESRLHYDHSFGPHNVEGLLLYNQRSNFYPSNFTSIPRRLVTMVGRFNYNYSQRYLFEVDLGYNGSQNFAKGQRFGFFPAVSGGWIVTNEPYFPDISFLNFLKFRASYGIVGNDQGVGRFLYLADQYNANSDGYNFGIDVPEDKPGNSEGALGNQQVTWAKAKKQNYGIDMRLFNNQLKMSFDYFHQLRTDILTDRNVIPNYVAADFPAGNIGEVENHGYEIQASWQQNLGDFFYSVGGNVSFTRNKILEMDEVPQNYDYQRHTGEAVGQRFGYIVDGYYTQKEIDNIGNGEAEPTWPVKPGYFKYKDLNGDGIINSDDQKPVGYPENSPEYSFGSNITLGYKNLNLNMTWAAAINVSEMILYSPYKTPFGENRKGLMNWIWEGHWTPEKGQNAGYPRLTLADNNRRNDQNADFWMADASYIRLKNIQLGYNLDANFLRKLGLGLKKASIYVSGYNVLTFSGMMDKYSIDPERNATNYQSQYPLMKSYNVGISLEF